MWLYETHLSWFVTVINDMENPVNNLAPCRNTKSILKPQTFLEHLWRFNEMQFNVIFLFYAYIFMNFFDPRIFVVY